MYVELGDLHIRWNSIVTLHGPIFLITWFGAWFDEFQRQTIMMMVVFIIIITFSRHFQFDLGVRTHVIFFLCLPSSCWGLERSLLINSLALFLFWFYVVREFDKCSHRGWVKFAFSVFLSLFFSFRSLHSFGSWYGKWSHPRQQSNCFIWTECRNTSK